MIRTGAAMLLAAALLFVLPSRPSAHEIPPHVTVLAFVRPDGQRLRVLVRVPLEAMRDVDFPLSATGFLDLERVRPLLGNAAKLWIADYLELYENGQLLEIVEVAGARVSLPSDRSFSAWDDAIAHSMGAPLPPETEITWRQAMLDVLFEYPIDSEASEFSIHPGLAHLGIRTATVLRFVSPGGAERAFRYTGDPGLVRLDPRSHQAAFHFVKLGFFHILDGIDHLLFVLCLVIPFRRFRPLVAIVTSFTVAHSITLIASAMGFAPNALWFPPLIETLIALSIVYLAFENIVGAARKTGPEPASPATAGVPHRGVGRRWLVAFVFGLVHGFGFSFLLRESLQFAGSHLTTSLLAFNLGVELGQVFVLALAIPLLTLLFLYVVPERVGTILLSALVAHTAWHWMTERGLRLAQYDFQWPALDMSLVASLMRGLMIILILLAAVWLTYVLIGRMMGPRRVAEPPASSVERP
ncbi:MAG: HupE/UreJ family protein [Longimicrobiales bacterium]